MQAETLTGKDEKTEQIVQLLPEYESQSANGKRRNLNSDQLACIAVDALPLYEAEAKKRKAKAGGDRKSDEYKSVSQKIDPPISDSKKSKTKSKNANRSSQKAAKKLNTNRQYVSDAKKLKAEKPELFGQSHQKKVTEKIPEALNASTKAENRNLVTQKIEQQEPVSKKAKRDAKIFDLWMACHTQDEIAELVGCKDQSVISDICKDFMVSVLQNQNHKTAANQSQKEVSIIDLSGDIKRAKEERANQRLVPQAAAWLASVKMRQA